LEAALRTLRKRTGREISIDIIVAVLLALVGIDKLGNGASVPNASSLRTLIANSFPHQSLTPIMKRSSENSVVEIRSKRHKKSRQVAPSSAIDNAESASVIQAANQPSKKSSGIKKNKSNSNSNTNCVSMQP
jgi:hypothetical protein